MDTATIIDRIAFKEMERGNICQGDQRLAEQMSTPIHRGDKIHSG